MRHRYIFLCLGLLCSTLVSTTVIPNGIVSANAEPTGQSPPRLLQPDNTVSSETTNVALESVITKIETQVLDSTTNYAMEQQDTTVQSLEIPLQPNLPATNAKADFRAVPNLRQHLPLNVPEAANLTSAERKDIECMAWNLYFEVRGGSHKEQIAIAYVPINRIGKPDFGNDICTNVFQYGIHNGQWKHQFSWAGIRLGANWHREDDAWEKMQQLAIDVYHRRVNDSGKGATYFHSVRLQVSWAPKSNKLIIGQHLFWS